MKHRLRPNSERRMPPSTTKPIPELVVVVLRNPVEHDGSILPAGSTGTVVHAYPGGQLYEVEFAKPFPCVVTVNRDDVLTGR